MYKSKTRREKATELQKMCSKFNRKLHMKKILIDKLKNKLIRRKTQQTRDHNFIEIFKENSFEIYNSCKLEYEKEYGQDKKRERFIKNKLLVFV